MNRVPHDNATEGRTNVKVEILMQIFKAALMSVLEDSVSLSNLII